MNPKGITGRTTKKNIVADRVLLKAQQRTSITVSVLNGKLLKELTDGTKQLRAVLAGHYVEERFDLYRKYCSCMFVMSQHISAIRISIHKISAAGSDEIKLSMTLKWSKPNV